jgi:hypothetical protein
MAIEFFKEMSRGFEPKVSIRKQGQIGLNNGAITRYRLKDGQEFLLGYDKETETIVIKPVKSKEAGSKKLAIRSKTGTISVKGFFDYFSIPYKNKTTSYELQEDKNEGYFFFHIGKEDSK